VLGTRGRRAHLARGILHRPRRGRVRALDTARRAAEADAVTMDAIEGEDETAVAARVRGNDADGAIPPGDDHLDEEDAARGAPDAGAPNGAAGDAVGVAVAP